ncbi:MAG: hypothetical protein A2Z18_11050 [Armatimonadetes bacterium RBG_16_58_9]|nr:MAG: hypothetical protein A2Z18_11050 [Armatimonadetes bacterium RBG_16_58_9]
MNASELIIDIKMERDLTILIAHPDDELLFLWPFLARAERLVCVVSDKDNPERAWCARRAEALSCVCDLAGIDSVECLDYNSEFYRLPTRDESLKRMAENILEALSEADIIATHNPWGEYGNLDHILCHQIARQTNARLLTTGIAQAVNWLPIRTWSPGRALGHHQLDRALFDQCKAVYDALGCWTWSLPPVESVEVYSAC